MKGTKKIGWVVLLAALMMMMGCERKEEPAQQVSMPFSLYLPVSSAMLRSQGAPRRTLGDPGKAETFLFPHFVYVFVLKEEDEEMKVVRRYELTPENEDWEPMHYIGTLHTEGDTIYRYSHKLEFLLTEKGEKGEVYAIASPVALTFDKSLAAVQGRDDVLDLKIDVSSDEIQINLNNIYTSPYNYQVGGKYYGSYDNSDYQVVSLDLMLYHIAAKVDITWSVADDKRIKATPSEAVRLTKMKACNLFNGNAYCFKPMENSSGASPLNPAAGTGDTVTIVTPTDEGLWWEGRSYFYTIPYTTTTKPGYFPLQMEMETNKSGDDYRQTIYLQMNTTSPFVPWMRATFNLTAPLAAGTGEDKTVNY